MTNTLEIRDLNLSRIEAEIKNKKSLLIRKKKDLDKKHNLNDYLYGVKDDYSKYYNFILEEKQNQHQALSLLKEYIDDLNNTEKIIDEQATHVKHDQRIILEEIEKVKSELDDLVQ